MDTIRHTTYPPMRLLVLLIFLLIVAAAPAVLGGLAHRRGWKRVARVAWLVAAVLGLLVTFLWAFERGGWQRDSHANDLLYLLDSDSTTLHRQLAEGQPENILFLYSTSATALARIASAQADQRNRIAPVLRQLAAAVANTDHFPQWNRRGDWDLHLYFLAHAAIVLGEYQLLTGDETWADSWQRASDYLGRSIINSRYKHLASRPNDIALRPTDNAAALYAIYLHDRYYAADQLPRTAREWTSYLTRELEYNFTSLPCSGFSTTDRCRLLPVGDNMALLTAYAGEARVPVAATFWRETRHYYKQPAYLVTARLRTPPPIGDLSTDCNDVTRPLPCGAFPSELGQWAAATQRGWFTYYQLNNRLLWQDLVHHPKLTRIYNGLPSTERIRALQRLAIRLAAETAG